jgi:ribosome-binding ATPase YchF (GTP1/OBG family)
LVDALKACENALNAEKMINTISDTFTAEQLKLLKPYNLLTAKPFVYAINIGQDELSKAQEIKTHFETQLQKPVAIVCATVEHELMELESEEKEEFLQELAGSTTAHIPTLDDLIRLAFDQV